MRQRNLEGSFDFSKFRSLFNITQETVTVQIRLGINTVLGWTIIRQGR